jgi:hypothetical protein
MMATLEMLRPYVEQKIAEVIGADSVKVDPDGDIPIRSGSAVCFARLIEGPTGPMFRVFSPMLRGIDGSPRLLERLNQLNVGVPYARFFWHDEVIYCAADLLAENIQGEEIANALSAVSIHADKLDDLLKDEFGGERMIEEDETPKPGPGDSAYL